MACFDEFPPMALELEGYGAVERVRGNEAVLDEKKAPLAAIIDEIQNLKMDKAAVGTGKAAIDKIQMEKMDKASVVDDMIQTEKMDTVGAQSDPPAGKYRIPDDYVRLILALKREEPMDPEENPYMFPGCSVEEARRQHVEEAALFKRIHDDFEPFQAMVRREWYEKGYVEVDYDYVASLQKVKDVHKEDWDEWRKHQESLDIEYADSDDEDYAGFYVPYDPEEVLEQFGLGEASQKMIALQNRT